MNTVRINGQDYTSSLSDAEIAFMGNLSLPTTAQTLSGAIAEHENDITELNSNLTSLFNAKFVAQGTNVYDLPGGVYIFDGLATNYVGLPTQNSHNCTVIVFYININRKTYLAYSSNENKAYIGHIWGTENPSWVALN
jgi:hypothetical protein